MTREEYIEFEANNYGDIVAGGSTMNTPITLAFIQGALFADRNPKSPWISVKDDLPCNHEELTSAKCETKRVFILKDVFGNPDIDYMLKENSKWRWFGYNGTKYWMPIPEAPKE